MAFWMFWCFLCFMTSPFECGSNDRDRTCDLQPIKRDNGYDVWRQFVRGVLLAGWSEESTRNLLRSELLRQGRKLAVSLSFNSEYYFFTISLPQHCNGTVHETSSPAIQEQALRTTSWRPQASHTKRSPSFICEQSAITSSPFSPNNIRLPMRWHSSIIYARDTSLGAKTHLNEAIIIIAS